MKKNAVIAIMLLAFLAAISVYISPVHKGDTMPTNGVVQSTKSECDSFAKAVAEESGVAPVPLQGRTIVDSDQQCFAELTVNTPNGTQHRIVLRHKDGPVDVARCTLNTGAVLADESPCIDPIDSVITYGDYTKAALTIFGK